MAFIREKKHGAKSYFYLVESHWNGGKVRQKVLKYLGTIPPAGYQSRKKASQ